MAHGTNLTLLLALACTAPVAGQAPAREASVPLGFTIACEGCVLRGTRPLDIAIGIPHRPEGPPETGNPALLGRAGSGGGLHRVVESHWSDLN